MRVMCPLCELLKDKKRCMDEAVGVDRGCRRAVSEFSNYSDWCSFKCDRLALDVIHLQNITMREPWHS